MALANIAWIVLLLPLVSAAAITLFTMRNPRLSGQLSITAVVVSFVASLLLFGVYKGSAAVTSTALPWLHVADLNVDIALRVDALSLLMLLIVTGVGGLIHIYSWGYMYEDPGFARYFASLSLFTFSMLGIVLASNFVMMFIFWELVGVSSYLLIGFWYERSAAADAAKKAFLTNRVGDFGFLLGIIMIWALAGSVQFDQLQGSTQALGKWATIAGLLIFCGAVGKSAQFPLHVWLPDAMEGPTPVSALIHAATMVAAGVYMLCRVSFIFTAQAHDVIAWIGGFTALLAALIAVQQNDIKRILAYSTLSQLGYMVLAVAISPTAAMFHLATHAFFKALLFLGAGSVIYALHHEQNIWKMGGLKRRMPITYWTFLIGTLALCGVPPFSGFFSKDAILAAAAHHGVALFLITALVAVLTTFYMFRLFFVAFAGPAQAEHAHESPKVMTWPLILLAIPSILAGIWGIDQMLGGFFNQTDHASGFMARLLAPFGHSPLAASASLLAVVVGFSLAYTTYRRATSDPIAEHLGIVSRAMRKKFYFDEIYDFLIRATHETLARLADFLDRALIEGFAVRGVYGTTDVLGRALRLLQTGNIQTYTFLFATGVAIVLLMVLNR
ncbi:MAG TPA: NADH-quinone oxidoreductase subunit L [Verrucomicrobiae bacterium]|nr:NADH-quinone oxidoreductase subunit L [Verrucomicrobiae bacterium]